MKKLFLLISYFILWIWFINFSYWDALDDVLWSSSKWWNYQIVNEKDLHVSSKIKKTVQLLLKITIILWVIVFLFWWIRFMMSMWDDSKAKKVRDTLIVSIIWFVIAFWAWIILQLILSVWTTVIQWTTTKTVKI